MLIIAKCTLCSSQNGKSNFRIKHFRWRIYPKNTPEFTQQTVLNRLSKVMRLRKEKMANKKLEQKQGQKKKQGQTEKQGQNQKQGPKEKQGQKDKPKKGHHRTNTFRNFKWRGKHHKKN